MEEEIGAQLFIRDSSPIQITPAGEQFRQHAENTLLAWQQLRKSVSTQVSDLTGQLTLFCSVTASYSFLADLLSRFRDQYPKVDLRIHTGEIGRASCRERV